MIIEKWRLSDALYMTVITLSTVGFQEVHSLSTVGRYFTMFLILGGTGTILYAATAIVQYLLEGNLENILGRRHMKAEIASLRDIPSFMAMERLVKKLHVFLLMKKHRLLLLSLMKKHTTKQRMMGNDDA